MSPASAIPPLSRFKRIVVKVGSALLVKDGRVRQKWLTALARDCAEFNAKGQQCIIVTSGAIALGRSSPKARFGRKNSLKLEEKQAAAALGQPRLIEAWQQALAPHDLDVGQILLTFEDTEERRRHLNARAAILQLLGLGTVPIINENDSVATAEIRYGDNDRLAARVATMVSADLLVLLSDIDGLYSADPRHDPDAWHFPVIEALTPEIMAMAGGAPIGYSSGGMVTKLEAARIALGGGCHMVIAKGDLDHPLRQLEKTTGNESSGELSARSTWFLPSATPQAARKRWIGGALDPKGRLRVDQGAAQALRRGSSLLPKGITAVEGYFERGDPIEILEEKQEKHPKKDQLIAIGLCAYSSAETARILSCHSDEIAAVLGYAGRNAVVHRDDLSLIENPKTPKPAKQR